MKNFLKIFYRYSIMTVMLLFSQIAWASEVEKDVWIQPIESVILITTVGFAQTYTVEHVSKSSLDEETKVNIWEE